MDGTSNGSSALALYTACFGAALFTGNILCSSSNVNTQPSCKSPCHMNGKPNKLNKTILGLCFRQATAAEGLPEIIEDQKDEMEEFFGEDEARQKIERRAQTAATLTPHC
eukprot:306100-Amphidinium_carterae.1